MDSNLYSGTTPSEIAVQNGMILWSLITGGFIAFLAFVPRSSSEKSKIYRPTLFVIWSCVSVGGTILTWLIVAGPLAVTSCH